MSSIIPLAGDSMRGRTSAHGIEPGVCLKPLWLKAIDDVGDAERLYFKALCQPAMHVAGAMPVQ